MNNDFYNKAKDYSQGRPTYPNEILDTIKNLGIHSTSTIADIGAGTGLLTKLLGDLGCSIVAVEPNTEMLAQCRHYCAAHPNITYLNSGAEKTTLDARSLDMITVAQAFHWFDKTLSKQEFKRILKENGYVLIVWNSLLENDEFTKKYMNLIHQYETKLNAGNSYFDHHTEKLNFFEQDYERIYFNHAQTLDEAALLANAASLSYTPSKQDRTYDAFASEIKSLFDQYHKKGFITFHYQAELSICQFAK